MSSEIARVRYFLALRRLHELVDAVSQWRKVILAALKSFRVTGERALTADAGKVNFRVAAVGVAGRAAAVHSIDV